MSLLSLGSYEGSFSCSEGGVPCYCRLWLAQWGLGPGFSVKLLCGSICCGKCYINENLERDLERETLVPKQSR